MTNSTITSFLNKVKNLFSGAKKYTDKLNPRLNEYKIFQNAYYWFIVPLAIVFIALVCGTVYRFTNRDFINLGIDFRGGTMLTVNVDSSCTLTDDECEKEIVRIINENGVEIGATPQQGGSGSIFVRYSNVVNGEELDSEGMVVVNEEISAKIVDAFGEKTTASAKVISASARDSLIKKACLSIGIALLLMLVYIIIRFNFFSAISAICGLIHDIIIMFALVIIFRVQVNSSMIACFITIVSYGINNTIVVFDRIRENIKPYKAKQVPIDVRAVVNGSVGDVIKRTFLSTLTTLITITVLAIYGGALGIQTLTEFALPIIFGLIAGMYSSTFISPTIWGLITQARNDAGRKAKRKKARR